jgi:hypothetical protein
MCFLYGDGYRKCTETCTPMGCPAPSQGCNGKDVCGCNPYSPPVDAGSDGEYRDAAVSPAL